MTTGSYSLDAFQPATGGSWVGTKGSVSWSGADEPRSPRVKAVYYEILREEVHPRTGRLTVKVYKVRRPGFTPKRARHAEHAYSKTYQRLEQEWLNLPGAGPFPDFLFASAGAWSAESLLTSNDQIRLVNKLTEQLKGSDFNMSVFLGEGHQTLKLLADTAIRVAKAGHHVRKGDLKGASRSLFEGTSRKPLANHDWKKNPTWSSNATSDAAKNLSSRWLELQYGWLPLLNDAEECAKSLAHYLNFPVTKTYRVQVRRETNKDVTANPNGLTTLTHHQVKSHRRSLVARISEKPTGFATLGLLDPELVAWELVPFSFVADWFIPIGSWLEARASASRLTGTFITSDKRFALAGPIKLNGVQYTSSRYRHMLFDRVISTSLSVPMPEFKPLGKALSVGHLRNALALVTQVFTGAKVRS